MEAFSNFSISSPEAVFGGTHEDTLYTMPSGGGGKDKYDTETDNVVYFKPSF